MFSLITGNSFAVSLGYCVLPFAATDSLKAVLGAATGILVRRRLRVFET
jgi:hypothetical protein